MLKDTINNGTFRKRENPFAQVSNAALRDENLSLKAKGLYSLIQSYITIPDFTLYKWYLMKQCKEGERAFNSAWNELKQHGYLKQYRIPNAENGFFVYQYELLDKPDLSQPPLLNLKLNGEISEPKDHMVQNVGDGENTDHTLQNAPDGFCTPSEPDQVQNVGGMNKTEHTNTDQNNMEVSCPATVEKDVENLKLVTKDQYICYLKAKWDYNRKTAHMEEGQIAALDTIIGFIGDLLVNKRKSLRIGQRTIRTTQLRQVFLNLKFEYLQEVYENLSTCRSKIKNLKQYIWSCLYNLYQINATKRYMNN